MITLRVSQERLAQIDAIVGNGGYRSRAALLNDAIDRLLADVERERIDRAIVEGYTRMPQTDEELAWAEQSTIESIRAEPW
jgi:Arc/MetJ-type ribon-helix-helix transcriptional regulator